MAADAKRQHLTLAASDAANWQVSTAADVCKAWQPLRHSRSMHHCMCAQQERCCVNLTPASA